MDALSSSNWLSGEGEMVRRIRQHRWQATPLGPLEQWPATLRTALAMVLDHPMPMVLAWGPDLIALHNDAYRPLLGDKPDALGRPFLDIWDEARSTIAPQIDRALAGEAVRLENAPFTLLRREEPEEAFFDYTFSPVRDENGTVVGLLNTALETTGHVLAKGRRAAVQDALRESEERQAFLLALGDAMRARSDANATIEAAARLLGERLRASRVMFAEFDEARGIADIFHGWFADGAEPFPTVMRLVDYEGPILSDLRAGRTVRVEDTGDPRSGRPDFAAIAELGVKALLSVPLIVSDRLVVNLSVHQHAAREWTDNEVALVREVAERLWADLVRARAEAALRESEERLRQFGDASRDILWIRDAGTLQWTYLTPAFETIYGLSRAEALAGDNYRNWQDLILPGDRAHAVASVGRTAAGEHVTFEFRIRRPVDGQVRWIRNTNFPIRDGAGRVTRIGGIGHDVTAMKATEAALAAAERRQRLLLEGIPQLVWRAVDGGHWTWASPQWTSYTGQAEVDSHGLGWLDTLHPEDRGAAQEAWSHAEETGGFQVEYRIRRSDRDAEPGEYRWFKTRAAPVRDAAGGIVEWLGTSTDIHGLRLMQERQKVLVAELQHRTRNLIAVVRATAEKTARASASLGEFRAAFLDRLNALARVQGLLSRLGEDERVTFDELIGAEMSALNGAAERVVLSGPPGVRLRSSMVQALAMGLHELATNALKYGALGQPQGRLTISWALRDGNGGEPRLGIDWRESNVTMPPPDAGPAGTGQGRMLIERALPHQLGARTTYVLGPDGVHCEIEVPVSARSAEREGELG